MCVDWRLPSKLRVWVVSSLPRIIFWRSNCSHGCFTLWFWILVSRNHLLALIWITHFKLCYFAFTWSNCVTRILNSSSSLEFSTQMTHADPVWKRSKLANWRVYFHKGLDLLLVLWRKSSFFVRNCARVYGKSKFYCDNFHSKACLEFPFSL